MWGCGEELLPDDRYTGTGVDEGKLGELKELYRKSEEVKRLRKPAAATLQLETYCYTNYFQREDEKLAAEKKRIEKEVDEEGKRKLDETTKAVEGYNAMKDRRLKDLTELEEKIAKKREQIVENLKKSGTNRIESETQKLRNEKTELIAQRELLAYEISKLDGVKEENLKERGREIRRMEEEEAAQIAAHHEKMSKMKTSQLEDQVDMERKRIRMAERMKEEQVAIGKEKEYIQAIESELKSFREFNSMIRSVYHAKEMMGELTKEQKLEDFRHDCNMVINHYNSFKKHFDSQETDLLTTRDDILYGDTVVRALDESDYFVRWVSPRLGRTMCEI